MNKLIAIKKEFKKNWLLWLMFAPVFIYYFIFNYKPMYGILLAFKDYKIKKGIMGSPWVGFEHFERFFSSYNFGMLLKNTLWLSVYSLLVSFPLAIIFALLLHYLTLNKLKKVVQMVSYAPYFISTVVIVGMLQIFTDYNSGIFNVILGMFGKDPVNFMAVPQWFDDIYVWSGVWQGMGWSAIIYISSLAGVDSQMHEAATIDGATKLQRIRYIDLPSIQPTIIMLLIMKLGSIMSIGFEKVYLMQNDLNFAASDIISTYTYRVGLIDSDFSYSTAVGLFNTVINLVILISANFTCRKATGESLW